MEDALAPSPTPIAAPLLTRRRSHLDSSSYRTLSRLFTHCVHLHSSRSEGTAPPEVELPTANPTGLDSGDSPQVPKDADFGQLTDDVEKEAEAAGIPSRQVTSSLVRDQPSLPNPTSDPGQAEASQVVLEDMNVTVESSCCNLGAASEEPVVEAGLVVDDEALRSMKACLEGDVDELVDEAVGNDDGQMILDAIMTNFTGLIDDIGVSVMPAPSCGVSEGELRNSKESECKQFGGGNEEERHASNSEYRQLDGGGFEEGEIEGELQDLDAEELDSDNEEPDGDSVSRGSEENEFCAHLAPEIKGNYPVLNKDVDIRNDGQISVTRAQAVSYDEVLDWNKTPLPDNENLKSGKKRKRHVTEERKAKKTKNKRMNRAQKRIAEGVHKLKFQPVMKPKTVKPCHFYNHGKCQQGDSCKFSHDFIPLTKSKPCKHFATVSCLKGDDCPFDHELSKYPCHKYKSGMCYRGDNCKFSHALSATGITATTDATKSYASLVFGNTNLIEQTSSLKTSTIHNAELLVPAPIKQQHSILKNLAGISIDSQKISTRVPKGVQFLPFGRGGSNLNSGHQGSLPIEKHMNANVSIQDQYLGGRQADGQTNVKQNGKKLVTLLDEKYSSKEATLPTDSTETPVSIHTQHEVSEASRILQEFLFGTGS